MSQLLFCDIQLETAELINVRLGLSGPAKECLGPGEKLLYAEGLCNVIVCAEVEAHNNILLLVLSGEHNYRRIDTLITNLAANLEAVDFGQHYIEDNQVRIFFQRRFQPRLAIESRFDLVALHCEIVLKGTHHCWIVFNYKYRIHIIIL